MWGGNYYEGLGISQETAVIIVVQDEEVPKQEKNRLMEFLDLFGQVFGLDLGTTTEFESR